MNVANIQSPRKRTRRLLESFTHKTPRLSLDRARIFTSSFKTTEHLPTVLRWAMALAAVLEEIPIHILPDELIVGRGGPPGRYGIFYPELEGAYFSQVRESRDASGSLNQLSAEDQKVIHDELLPYWSGKTFRESLAAMVPEQLKNLLYKDGNIYSPSFVIHETATVRHSLQWVPDYEKVLTRGFCGICAESEEKLAQLDINSKDRSWDKAPFYKGIIIFCKAIKIFAGRHAELAHKLAQSCEDESRKKELQTIAEICGRVPWLPARNFYEALQAQWFTQLVSRLEQLHGGIISNGRMDQYLYPFFVRDISEGLLDKNRALELLDCLWCNMAQYVRVQPTSAGIQIYEGHAHWEHATIGGQLEDGMDASNELSWLLLRSKEEFPLDEYPYLGLRVYSGTPQAFLERACKAIREKRGPILLNDEEIIPLLARKGASLPEARNYSGSGCSEVRLPNRNTYLSGTTWFNMAAVLEMTLYNGYCSAGGDFRPLGLATGDACNFARYDAFEQSFYLQLDNILKYILIQQYIADTLRKDHLAAPLVSSLHDLCMAQGRDINEGKFDNGLSLGGQIGATGFATVVDSLAAIRWLVYDTKQVSMSQLISALKANFEGYEVERQLCLHSPKFGNQDHRADSIASRLEQRMISFCGTHANYYGGIPEIFLVPVTAHKAMGNVTGATPDGRRAGEALSAGISPVTGSARLGVTAILQSAAASKYSDGLNRASRMLGVSIPPAAVQGHTGLKNMSALIRAWCRLRLWHLEIDIQDENDLRAASNMEEKLKGQFYPFPGYAATPMPFSENMMNALVKKDNKF